MLDSGHRAGHRPSGHVSALVLDRTRSGGRTHMASAVVDVRRTCSGGRRRLLGAFMIGQQALGSPAAGQVDGARGSVKRGVECEHPCMNPHRPALAAQCL